MTKRRTDRTATNLAQRLDQLAAIIPHARTHLNEQRHHTPIIQAATTDTTRPPSGHPDPTLTTVEQLDQLNRLEGYIDDALASIRVGIHQLDEACRNAQGHRPSTVTVLDDPICYHHNCSDPVGSYRLRDGTIRYRMGGKHGGLCDRHRIAAARA